MRASRPVLAASAAALVAVLLAACGDATAPGADGAAVQLSLAPRTNTLPAGGAAPVPAGELVIQRVQLVFREIELTTANAGGTGRDDDDACRRERGRGRRQEVELGPVLFDARADATTPQPQLRVEIPAGTYCELELELQKPTGDDGREIRLRHPDLRDASVRVEGIYRGQPFVYVGDVEAELELDFAPPLVVTDDARNVTLDLDVARWFTDAAGRVIDPTTANRGGANRALVERNIRASFAAFEDDDRDGRDDRGGRGRRGDDDDDDRGDD